MEAEFISTMQPAFATTAPLRQASPFPSAPRRPRTSRRFVARRPRVSASLSSPFPLPDLFAFPNVAFLASTASSDFRPELLGSVLWSAGLYLGFSQRKRWGSVVYETENHLLTLLKVPQLLAEVVTLATHSLPFLAAGFGIDAALRHANGGNAIWAVAAGVSVAMYGGIYELGRSSAGGSMVSEDDRVRYELFDDFARRRLRARGMCHLIDIRAAVRRDAKARRLGALSDEHLRRFVKNRFPRAKRSPNGYYRGLSLGKETKGSELSSAGLGEFEEW